MDFLFYLYDLNRPSILLLNKKERNTERKKKGRRQTEKERTKERQKKRQTDPH